jgi:hypothetical protein
VEVFDEATWTRVADRLDATGRAAAADQVRTDDGEGDDDDGSAGVPLRA